MAGLQTRSFSPLQFCSAAAELALPAPTILRIPADCARPENPPWDGGPLHQTTPRRFLGRWDPTARHHLNAQPP